MPLLLMPECNFLQQILNTGFVYLEYLNTRVYPETQMHCFIIGADFDLIRQAAIR
ncbi:hypothetical protein SAMN05428975_0496 [Mucilaginibacter sp. OK268]|nr:hypothetical protein SAMN05428975_0496 [Mucilaginibacter sp. OK268]